MSGVELSDVIQDLRENLLAAQHRGESETLRFAIDEVEMEFHVTISKDIKPGAKVKFEVLGSGVELGADAKVAHETGHKIKLKMKVVDTRPEATKDRGLISQYGARPRAPGDKG